MMPIRFPCSACGKTMRAPDAFAGKKAKCPLCGAVQVIPAEDDAGLFPPVSAERPPAAQPAAPTGAETVDCPGCGEAMPRAAPACPACGRVRGSGLTAASAAPSTAPTRGFWADAMLSFAMPFRGGGAFLFGFVVLMHIIYSVLGFAGCIGSAGQFIIAGWLCSYYLNIIQDTCAGQDALPNFTMTEGMWDDVVRPLLLFLGGTAVVLFPLLAWAALRWYFGAVFGSGPDAIVGIVLLLGGLFLWPMTILTIAVHGFSLKVLRYDMQLLTIVRAFPPYLAIWLLLIVVAVGAWVCTAAASLAVAILGLKDIVLALGIFILSASLLQGYVGLVSMRTIGLFYRHHKRHFAWEAE